MYETLGMKKERETPGILAFPPNWVKCDEGKQSLQLYAHSKSR